MKSNFISLIEIAGKGGICHYTYNLAEALSKTRGIELSTAIKYELHDKPHSFKIKRIFKRFMTNPLRVLYYVYSLKRESFRIVHIQLSQHPLFVLLLVKLIKILTQCKIVITSHNLISHEEKVWEKLIYQKIYDDADKIIVHAKQSKDLISEYFLIPNDKVDIIQHGNYMFFNDITSEPNIGSIAPAGATNKEEKVILFFGYIRKYKGLQYLIQAFAKLITDLPEAKLLIVGKPVESFDHYQKQIQSLNIKSNIEFHLEYVPFSKVKEYFMRARVVVLPYLSISQSGIVQLAYGFGKPVIATSVGGLPEVVEDGKSGFIVPPHDIDFLAYRIKMLLLDTALQKILGEYCLHLATTKFSWEEAAQSTLRVYDTILS